MCWPTSSRSPAAPSMMRGAMEGETCTRTQCPAMLPDERRPCGREHVLGGMNGRMPDFLTLYAAAQPDKPAVIDDRPDGTVTTLSYAELEDRANRLANVLLALGVRPGSGKVVWCGQNSPGL